MSPETARQFVRWSSDDGVATVTLDRPPLNPLSHQLKAEISECLDEIAADQGVRCVILYGAGGRAFSVGADIKEFPEIASRRLGRQHAMQEHALYNRIDFFPVPTIAAIEGHCLGRRPRVGPGLRPTRRQRGLPPGAPRGEAGRLPGGRRYRASPTPDRRLPCPRADLHRRAGGCEGGVAARPGEPSGAGRSGLAAAKDLGRTITQRAGLTLRTLKAVMDRGQCMDLMEAQQVSVDAISELFQSEAVQEGVRAFLEKRPPKQ